MFVTSFVFKSAKFIYLIGGCHCHKQVPNIVFDIYYRGVIPLLLDTIMGTQPSHRVQKIPHLHRVIYELPPMLLLIQLHEQDLKMNVVLLIFQNKWIKTRITKFSIYFRKKVFKRSL